MTGVPIVVPPCETVKVTVPALTVPEPLVTVADRVTFCAALLNVTEVFEAAVVVAPEPTVKVWVLSLLGSRLLVTLKAAVIV